MVGPISGTEARRSSIRHRTGHYARVGSIQVTREWDDYLATRPPPWPGLCCHYSHWRTRWSQSREPSQILRGHREEEFVLGAAWAPQPQAPEPKNALEMSKQHLDLFPAATSSLMLFGVQ